ncbi:integral membrane protein [Thozetella sp. PMI_491]|nr:integral membrane protein [Thozetella sp. PMI_491]
MAESGEPAPVLTEEYLNEYSGGTLIGLSIAFATLTTIVLILRFYAKRFTRAVDFGLDDYFLVAAYVVNLGMCAIGITMVEIGGVGQHVEAVEERNPALLVGWAQTILAFEIVYFTSVALPKMAIVFLYLRIFVWKGGMRTAAHILLAALAATGFSLVMTACFQCRPLAFWWDRTIPGGTCIDVQTFFHAQAIPGIILDLFVMALPVRTIWQLKLPLHKRLALLFIFLVASFGIVASIIRAITFFGTAAFADRTWASVELVGWSIVETGTYIMTVCMPSLKPLISHYTPQSIKDMVRKGVSAASSSMSSSKMKSRRGAEEDTVELTMRSRRHKADVEANPALPSYGEPGIDYPSSEATVQVLSSPELVGGAAWGKMNQEAWSRGDRIQVTTEVTLERHPSVKGQTWV